MNTLFGSISEHRPAMQCSSCSLIKLTVFEDQREDLSSDTSYSRLFSSVVLSLSDLAFLVPFENQGQIRKIPGEILDGINQPKYCRTQISNEQLMTEFTQIVINYSLFGLFPTYYFMKPGIVATQVTKGEMRPNQLKNQSLEQSFIAGSSKETSGLCSKPRELPDGF